MSVRANGERVVLRHTLFPRDERNTITFKAHVIFSTFAFSWSAFATVLRSKQNIPFLRLRHRLRPMFFPVRCPQKGVHELNPEPYFRV